VIAARKAEVATDSGDRRAPTRVNWAGWDARRDPGAAERFDLGFDLGFAQAVGRPSRKFTVTVMMIGVGTPFTSVGV
jgi:hypothetical protein